MSRRYNELLPSGGHRQSNPFSRTYYDIFGGDSPDPPDYSKMAAASEKAAQLGYDLGQQQLAQNQKQYDQNMQVVQPIVDKQSALMDQQIYQGNDYYNYARQYSRPVEQSLFYDAMGLSPDEIQQITDLRNSELKTQQDAAAANPASPSYIDVPTSSIQTVLPDGAVKGSDLGVASVRLKGQSVNGAQPNNNFLAGTIAFNNTSKTKVDADSYYVKNSNGTYSIVQPTYKTVEGSQRVSIPNSGNSSSSSIESTPQADALIAKLSANAGQRLQDEAANNAIADARNGSTQQTNMAIRQGLRYGMSADKIAAANAANETDVAMKTAAGANAARTQAKAITTAKKLDVAGLYRGLPGVSQGAYNSANNAGNSAVNNQMQPSNAYMNGINQGNSTIMQGQGLGIQGLGNVLNAQTSVYNNSLNANNGAWGAIGSAIGGAMGNSSSKPWWMSDKKVKKNIKHSSDEKALEAVNKTPIKSWKYDQNKINNGDTATHIGAMAQDVKKNMGEQASNGHMVDLISMTGITMSAVKALSKKVDKLDKKLVKGSEK